MDFWYRVAVLVAGTIAAAAMTGVWKLVLDNAKLRGQLEEREKRYDDRFATIHRTLDTLPQMVDRIAEGIRMGMKELGDRFEHQAELTQAELRVHGESLAYLRGQAEEAGSADNRRSR